MNKIVILEEDQAIPSGSSRNSQENGVDWRVAVDSGELESSLIIDKPAYTVYLEGNRISFPKKEFELLLLLATNPRKVFKRNDILEHIWGKDFKQKDSRSLDVHIRMLRKKLNDSYITTIRGVGYKLEK
ncbi:MAG: winged helix-turn-helix transcriptional regulator [Bacteroidetes bacterium]|nr:winged helix-turn-helix transcriptional regulator [Bacteroidota bacterium]